MLVTKRDRWESTSQRASNNNRIDTRARGVEISVYRKRKCVCFFSFPKKENLLIRVRSALQPGLLLEGRQSAREQTRPRVWSRLPFVSPYLVLLRQSKAACSSVILLVVSLCCSPSIECSQLRQTIGFSFVTQSVNFRYPRSSLRSNK